MMASPLTDCIMKPSIFTKELSYPYQRHVVETQSDGVHMIFFPHQGTKGFRQTCNSEYASRFTRISLYLNTVPGSFQFPVFPFHRWILP